ncbi:MAG TPA: DUF6057 family protein [Bacteroidales bacterium]|nr:hypothetical protein [Bacteroidales bacterium]HQG52639.1 DUF6057 family protein [Bacteroidales bacterium]HRC90132.1 DUF6057 family protein [Bacteroidales bacterium]
MLNKKDILNQLLKWLPYILFFIFVFVFFCFYADHIFIYQEKYSLFIFSSEYLLDCLSQPGALLKYLSAFLSAFYYYPVAGSFIATTVIILSIIQLSAIIKLITAKENLLIPFLAGLLMFYLQADYSYMLYNNLGILIQLIAINLTIRYSKGYWPIIILPLWYFLNGGFAWIFYGIYCAWLIKSGFKKNLLKIILTVFVAVSTVYVAAELIFWNSYHTLFEYPWSPGISNTDNIIFVFLVLLICTMPLISRVKFAINSNSILNQKTVYITGIAFLIFGLTASLLLRYDEKSNKYFKAEKLFYDGKYDDLINYNMKYPTKNIITLYLNNIALCETGRLNEMLFTFPQSPDGSTLFLKWTIENEILRHGGNFYFTTGMINEALRWAYEYMVMRGYTPEGLKMMIKCELINGNYQLAENYIELLKRTIFYHKAAIEFEKLLYNDEAIINHPQLGAKKKMIAYSDFFVISDYPQVNLERIISTDSLYKNRNAWEYWVAWLMLEKSYRGIANEWFKIEKYGFTRVPRHIEEAAVAMRTLLNVNLPDLGGLRISSSVERKYLQFLQIFQASGADPKKAEPFLRKDFGNTFWYYIFYK